jgi:hypothetical protein
MELVTQNFLPYFFSTLGIGSALIIVLIGLGLVASMLDKKILRNRR